MSEPRSHRPVPVTSVAKVEAFNLLPDQEHADSVPVRRIDGSYSGVGCSLTSLNPMLPCLRVGSALWRFEERASSML